MTGRTLAHYKLLEKLGEGGMGAVYRAEDTRLGRLVAVKILSAEKVADPHYVARFLQEARLASSLNHPNIATIHDVGEADGLYYIAMELVEGESLRRRVAGQPLKLGPLLDLALQIAEALAEAHGRSVVHRDIKGDNILVTPQGRIKMLDFGLAKRLPSTADATLTLAANLTETGVVMGTVSYMSPEQALGQPVDARSHLFSFGVVLYEMATGRLPFEGVIDKILHGPPPPPRGMPPALEDLLLKLLEKDAADRYQSPRDLVVDLRRLKKAHDLGKLETTRLRAAPSAPVRNRVLVWGGRHSGVRFRRDRSQPPLAGTLGCRRYPRGPPFQHRDQVRRCGSPAGVYDFRNPPRQVFQGWVLWQEWTHAGDLLVAQGRADLTVSLWRVRPDGAAPVRTITLPTYYSYYVNPLWMFMFDAHPDGRRIVVPMLESHEADIGMIENLVN